MLRLYLDAAPLPRAGGVVADLKVVAAPQVFVTKWGVGGSPFMPRQSCAYQ
jgi:hypothetical protein